VVRVTTEVILVLESVTNRFAGQGMEGLYSISEEVLKLQHYVGEPGANELGIDEALIALITPAIKQLLVDWNPLKDPTADGLTLILKTWSSVLHIQSKNQMEEFVRAESGLFHRQTKLVNLITNLTSRSTPYESLFYHIILPKLRSVINNEWSPYDPQPVIDLLDAWESLLPAFIHNTLLQQIIFPKLRHAIDHWNPRRSRDNVHLWIFPWLPYLGNHMDDLVKTVQHKFKTILEMWNISSGMIDGLEEWRDLFGKGVLENLLLKSIFPKLALELRENFTIDPSDQKLDVLMDKVMPWSTYFRASTWGQLLESEFFSKWLEMLHLWLTSEGANLEEVGQWYEWWKHQVFSSEILELEKVRKGFNEGLQLMSKAADYVDRGLPLSGLPLPSTSGPQRPVTQPVRPPKSSNAPRPPVQQLKETTFRDILEDLCAENNFILLPLREMEKNSGKALFRITANADAKGGVLGYIGEGDVLWLQKSRQGPYEPVSMEKMVEIIEKR
jgi:tuftelin-interacting protein 11